MLFRLVTGVAGSALIPAAPTGPTAWLQVLFLAIAATAVTMGLLAWAQARSSATRTAVLLTDEPVATALTSVLLGAGLSVGTVVGGALLVGAMLAVESGSVVGARIWDNVGSRWSLATPIDRATGAQFPVYPIH